MGYTNAGKSTLMRALTGSDVLVADKLFATLDTTVRALHPETKPRILVSDTVGFIKKLPHGLVASFKSTLDEALEASLLLQVVDASDPAFEQQLDVTTEVLQEIGAGDVPRSWCSTRSTGPGEEEAAVSAHLAQRWPEAIVMSARRPDEVAHLRRRIIAFFERHLVEEELRVPYDRQELRGEIFEHCQVLEERYDENGDRLPRPRRPRPPPEAPRRLSPRGSGVGVGVGPRKIVRPLPSAGEGRGEVRPSSVRRIIRATVSTQAGSAFSEGTSNRSSPPASAIAPWRGCRSPPASPGNRPRTRGT